MTSFVPLRAFVLSVCLLADALSYGRGITPEDYLKFEFVGSPVLSPDGRQVAFTLTRINEKANRRNTTIWVVPFDGSAPPRQLTNDTVSSANPQWSPDGGTLAFTSMRGEGARPQVWVLPMPGGEAQRLTTLKNGAMSYQWSQTGDRLVVVSKSGPSDKGGRPGVTSGTTPTSAISSTIQDGSTINGRIWGCSTLGRE